MMYLTLFAVLAVALSASAFLEDDKFLRKYSMMKVYESCFGADVVKEVRKEMLVAANKCAGVLASQRDASTHQIGQSLLLKKSQSNLHKIHGQQVHKINNKHDIHQSSSLVGSETSSFTEEIPRPAALQSSHQTTKQPSNVDLDKLQDVVMNGFNKQQQQQSSYSSTADLNSPPAYSNYQFSRPQYYGPAPLPPGPAPAPSFYPPPAHAQFHHQYVPYYQPSPFQPTYPPYFTGRSSRDLDVKGQLETLATKMSGKLRNMTCMMQELGYLDSNLEPDYLKMIDRIGRLPIPQDLRRDMADAVDYCRKFSQCVPDDSKDRTTKELVRPTFFFKCYKHKKLQACVLKDVRDRYSSLNDNLLDSRAGKFLPEDSMATAIYEFLYGDTESLEFDAFI